MSYGERLILRTDKDTGEQQLITLAEAVKRLAVNYQDPHDAEAILMFGSRAETPFAIYEHRDCVDDPKWHRREEGSNGPTW